MPASDENPPVPWETRTFTRQRRQAQTIPRSRGGRRKIKGDLSPERLFYLEARLTQTVAALPTTTRVIRVSHNAKLLIQQRAISAGITTSEWVRQVVSRQILDALNLRPN